VIWSDEKKTVAWVELISSWEENTTKWHFSKHEKYQSLARQVREKGWTTYPVYV
jgi:hypothetical protein